MPHIALVYLVVIRYLGQIYLTYGLSVIYGVTYKFPVTSTTIRNQINKHLRITVYIQVAYLRIDNRISGYIIFVLDCKVAKSSPFHLKKPRNWLYFNNFKELFINFYGTVVCL